MDEDYEKEEKEYEQEDEETQKDMDFESDYEYDQSETTGLKDNEELMIEEKVFQCKKCKKEIMERGRTTIIPYCPACNIKMTLISKTRRRIGETGGTSKKGKKK
jgi:ribosomal protein L37AE/L43A